MAAPLRDLIFLKKLGYPRPIFSFIFGLFKPTLQIIQQINVKNVHPVSIQHWDSNSRPSDYESFNHLSRAPALKARSDGLHKAQ